jgi:plastocyanin
MQRKLTFPPATIVKPRFLAIGAVIALAVAVMTFKVILPAIHPADQDFEEHNYEATVSVSEQGFLPGTLNVKPKTRVYFENHGTQNHRVMPTAEEPDGRFTAAEAILPNSGWAFTFTKPGSYKFYDANNPTANGEVIVR